MHACPACGGTLVRLPSSRLDQLIGILAGRRPFTCSECLWVGRLEPAPEQRRRSAIRAPQSALRGPQSQVPHRRRREALSSCPVCGHDTIVRSRTRWFDGAVAILTRRVPLVCTYCHWAGRRKPHRTVKAQGPTPPARRAEPTYTCTVRR